MKTTGTLEWPIITCPCYGNDAQCVCPDEERALRAWSSGRITQPMTPHQRAWCLDEIGRVEGYSASEHEADTDQQLASTVIHAWTDYARDKGLL